MYLYAVRCSILQFVLSDISSCCLCVCLDLCYLLSPCIIQFVPCLALIQGGKDSLAPEGGHISTIAECNNHGLLFFQSHPNVSSHIPGARNRVRLHYFPLSICCENSNYTSIDKAVGSCVLISLSVVFCI